MAQCGGHPILRELSHKGRFYKPIRISIMKALHVVAFILVLIGALNWGVLALTGWEVGQLFGGMDAAVSKLVYILVGLAAVYLVVMHKKDCKTCAAGM